ncbi:MAG: hypothetical protein U9O94_05005 [Nanoarchaeota archaeon]|nr:hypothetical protein [Nanoarchaeota archaeon]
MKEKIIIALIIGFSILGYGYINQKTKLQIEENKKAEQLRLNIQKESQETKLRQCLYQANVDYHLTWDNSCEIRGLREDCFLPTHQAESYNNMLKTNESNCIKIYGN